MITCGNCHTSSEDGTRFCGTCGIDLVAAVPADAQVGALVFSSAQAGTVVPTTGSPGSFHPAPLQTPLGPSTQSHRWRAILIGVGIALLGIGLLAVIYQVLSSRYTPERAAIAFVNALSTKNGNEILKVAAIVPPSAHAPAVTLTTASQITSELALPENSIGNVGKITILQSTTSGSTATVKLQFTSAIQVQTDTFQLIRSPAGPHFLFGEGWLVAVTPSTLKVTSESDATSLTIAGIHVPLHGGTASVGIFPSTVDAAMPPTANFAGQTQVVNATSEGSTQDVAFTPSIQPAVKTAAINAVDGALVACIESAQFTPPGCPNQDPNAPTPSGYYSYTGITWLVQGQAVSNPDVQVTSDGTIHVGATVTASDVYTENYGYGDFAQTQNYSSGPYTWNYEYNVSKVNGTWTATYVYGNLSNSG